MNYKRQKADSQVGSGVCNETNSGLPKTINQAGRYYYEVKRGTQSTGFTITHAGYFDVDSDGRTFSLTPTLNPGGIEYINCLVHNNINSFTIKY